MALRPGVGGRVLPGGVVRFGAGYRGPPQPRCGPVRGGRRVPSAGEESWSHWLERTSRDLCVQSGTDVAPQLISPAHAAAEQVRSSSSLRRFGTSSRTLPDPVQRDVQSSSLLVLDQRCWAVMSNIPPIPNWSTTEPASSPMPAFKRDNTPEAVATPGANQMFAGTARYLWSTSTVLSALFDRG